MVPRKYNNLEVTVAKKRRKIIKRLTSELTRRRHLVSKVAKAEENNRAIKSKTRMRMFAKCY